MTVQRLSTSRYWSKGAREALASTGRGLDCLNAAPQVAEHLVKLTHVVAERGHACIDADDALAITSTSSRIWRRPPLPLPQPPERIADRVGDWRAGLGRSLCSLVRVRSAPRCPRCPTTPTAGACAPDAAVMNGGGCFGKRATAFVPRLSPGGGPRRASLRHPQGPSLSAAASFVICAPVAGLA